MLRRHLKSGGAPVAACAGFDFDAASAYLENALGGSQRTGYESHLAGCAVCRRYLIELSRLAQTVPHKITPPTAIAERIPAWVRWREVAAGWFDLSTWKWNGDWRWRMVGATGATFAVLIAALGVQSWRQASIQQDIAVSRQEIPPASAGLTANESTLAQTPLPEASPEGAPHSVDGDLAALQPQRLRAIVPAPPVGPKAGETDIAVTPSTESMKLTSEQQGGPPAKTGQNQGRIVVQQDIYPKPGATLTSLTDSANIRREVLAETETRADSFERARVSSVPVERNEASNDIITARITPPPDINPMNSEAPPARRRGNKQTENLPSRLSALAMNLVPPGESESDRKAELKPLDDESFKSLKLTIRDKEFRYDRDRKMWIDRAYKPELQRWRLWPLKRGTKEYEQVLAADPQLKEFFDRAPIIIVWKNGKIYKVQLGK